MTWGIVINNNYMGRPQHCGQNNLFNTIMTYNLFQYFMNSLFNPQISQPLVQNPCCRIVTPSVFSQQANPYAQTNPYAAPNTGLNLGSETYQNLIESDYFKELLKSEPAQSFYPNLSLSSKTASDTSDKTVKKNNKTHADFSNNPANINTRYNGTAEDLNKKLANRGVLAGKGATFLKAQEEYGVNAAFLASICIHESGGTSNYAKNKNNVGGVRYPGSTEFRRFNSVDECIMYMARLLKGNYIDKGLTTISKVGAKYCPPNDPTDTAGTNGSWASYVSKIYNSFA